MLVATDVMNKLFICATIKKFFRAVDSPHKVALQHFSKQTSNGFTTRAYCPVNQLRQKFFRIYELRVKLQEFGVPFKALSSFAPANTLKATRGEG